MSHLCDTCILTDSYCSCDVEYDDIENVIVKCGSYSKNISNPVFTSMNDKWASFKRTYPNYPKTVDENTNNTIEHIEHIAEASNNPENKSG